MIWYASQMWKSYMIWYVFQMWKLYDMICFSNVEKLYDMICFSNEEKLYDMLAELFAQIVLVMQCSVQVFKGLSVQVFSLQFAVCS